MYKLRGGGRNSEEVRMGKKGMRRKESERGKRKLKRGIARLEQRRERKSPICEQNGFWHGLDNSFCGK